MSEGTISYNAAHNVTLSAEPSFIAVDKSDWNRMKRDLDLCKTEFDKWSCVGSVVLGISGSAFVTLLSLPETTENNTIKIVLLCSAIGFLFIGVISFIARHNIGNNFEKKIEDIKQDIKDIESKLVKK